MGIPYNTQMRSIYSLQIRTTISAAGACVYLQNHSNPPQFRPVVGRGEHHLHAINLGQLKAATGTDLSKPDPLVLFHGEAHEERSPFPINSGQKLQQRLDAHAACYTDPKNIGYMPDHFLFGARSIDDFLRAAFAYTVRGSLSENPIRSDISAADQLFRLANHMDPIYIRKDALDTSSLIAALRQEYHLLAAKSDFANPDVLKQPADYLEALQVALAEFRNPLSRAWSGQKRKRKHLENLTKFLIREANSGRMVNSQDFTKKFKSLTGLSGVSAGDYKVRIQHLTDYPF